VFVHYLQSWRRLPGSKTKATACFGLISSPFVCFSSGSSSSSFFLFLFAVLLADPFPFVSVLSLPLCSFSFFLPATLCFLSFFSRSLLLCPVSFLTSPSVSCLFPYLSFLFSPPVFSPLFSLLLLLL